MKKTLFNDFNIYCTSFERTQSLPTVRRTSQRLRPKESQMPLPIRTIKTEDDVVAEAPSDQDSGGSSHMDRGAATTPLDEGSDGSSDIDRDVAGPSDLDRRIAFTSDELVMAQEEPQEDTMK